MSPASADGIEKLKACDHPEDALPPHECPFQADVHSDADFRCTCCEECTYQCALDI